MRVCTPVVVVSILGFISGPGGLHAGGIPGKTLKELKAASVYIKVELTSAAAPGKTIPVTGSGFLVHVADGAGFIATNSHVVSPLASESARGNPKVVFHSGMPAEKTVEAQIVARDAVRDLAILRIVGFDGMPRPIPIDLEVEPSETMPAFAIGFPFGNDLALGKTNPAVTITKGTISSLRYDDRGQVKLVQIDAEINPGNSGGPIVDEKGRLLGVAVSKLVKARTVGFAIPLKPLVDMLQGKVASVVFDTLWVVKDHAEVTVEAALTDPLGKLKDAAIHYRLAGDKKDLPKADKDGVYPLLDNSSQLWLKMNKTRGQGRLTFKAMGKDKTDIVYQTSYVTASGTTVVSPPGFATLDFTQVVYSERLTRADLSDAKGKLYRVYTQPMKAGRYYVIDMRADPKDLDPRLVVQDAAGKELAEDDGAAGLFDALIAFTPPKDGEYQIVATALKGMGPFTLRIREDSARELEAKGLTVNERLAPGDAPLQAINLVLKRGKSYAVDVKSKEFDPFVRVENMAKVAMKSEDIGGNGHSTLFYAPLQDGIYRFVVSAFDAKVGRFEFAVRETPGPKLHELGPDGLTVAGMLTNGDALDIVNGVANQSRCKVFPIKLQVGQKYQIDLTSNQFDAMLRIEDTRGKELAFDDDSGGNLNARLMFTPKVDDVYRIIATNFDRRIGAFELTVKKAP